MRVLVTGADGFVGAWLVRQLLAEGHEVTGTLRPGDDKRPGRFQADEIARIRWVPLELDDDASVRDAVQPPLDAVVHLAGVSSVAVAQEFPGSAWTQNAAGTARLANALAALKLAGRADPLLLVVSSIEVYGPGPTVPRVEDDPVQPVSAYAASKLGAEVAALQEWRRTGLRAVIARPSPHTGAGQGDRSFVPKYARRIVAAKARRAPVITTGLLDGVRDYLHVADVCDAYVRLLGAGLPGCVYNVASGRGVELRDIVLRLGALADWQPVLEVDTADVRSDAIPHLVGDATRLARETGWAPRRDLDQTLQDVLDAQAH